MRLAFLGILLALQGAPQNGVIEGVVVEQGTTNALDGVTVLLVPEGKGTRDARGTISNEAGRFKFENVQAGRYEVRAERPGFAKLKRPGGPSLLRLDDGQNLKDIRIQLLKLPVISGRVLDGQGAPIPNTR